MWKTGFEDRVGTKKKVSSLEQEAKKVVDFNPSTAYYERNIKNLKSAGIDIKSPNDIVTLYHGSSAKNIASIEKNGLNPQSFLATDKNATNLFAGEKGKVIEIKVPASDLGVVFGGGMAGSKGVSIQTIDKLVKGKDGIWRIK